MTFQIVPECRFHVSVKVKTPVPIVLQVDYSNSQNSFNKDGCLQMTPFVVDHLSDDDQTRYR